MKDSNPCATVATVRAVVVAGLIAVIAVVASGCSSSDSSGVLAPITLEGVGGAKTWMAPEELRRAWNMPLAVIQRWGSSTNYEYAAICKGDVVGAAFFVNEQLRALVFFRGAKTDRNVGIGSTVREMHAAYGRRLVRMNSTDFGEHGPGWRIVATHGEWPRNAIQFNTYAGMVKAVQWGVSDALSVEHSYGGLEMDDVLC